MPKVSVIIPTYNYAKYLPETIDSVLRQTYQDLEIIVIDDGSTDNTKEIIQRYIRSSDKIKYILQENKGPAAARNRGIKEAKGEYIAFLDSDDIWVTEKLDIQASYLEQNKDIFFLYAKADVLNEHGKKIGIKPESNQHHEFKKLIFEWGYFPTATVMIRKECFDKVGFFSEDLRIMEDIHLWIRISRHYKMHGMDQILGIYHRHSNNVTLNKELVYKSTAMVYEKILAEFPNDVPRKKLRQRIAQYYYQLGKYYFDLQRYPDATRHVWHAIKTYPFVRQNLLSPRDPFFKRGYMFFKPYIALCACCLFTLFKKDNVSIVSP